MTRAEQIQQTARPGDIILVRKRLDPIRQKRNEETVGFWREAYLYMGDSKVIEVFRGRFFISHLSGHTHSGHHVGLFRSREGLVEVQGCKVVGTARKMMGIRYNLVRLFRKLLRKIYPGRCDPDLGIWYKTALSSSEFVAKVYAKLGMNLGSDPVDFDQSELTVRIL